MPTCSIKSVVSDVGHNIMYLPAIQRKFVWDETQIEDLFDSIYKGYPIGLFLFWRLSKKDINADDGYTFYKFIGNYHERDPFNPIADQPEMKEEITGVLDGQQRISALFIALQGSLSKRRKHGRIDDPEAYPKKFLYWDLLYNDKEETGKLGLKFLTEEEAKNDNESQDKILWFKV